MARPTKLTTEITDQLFNLIRMGLPIIDACSIAGISESSYYSWKKSAENGESPKFLKFLEDLKKAESEAKEKLLQHIQRDQSWQSKAWILERRWAGDWGRKDHIRHEAEITGDIQLVWPSQIEDE